MAVYEIEGQRFEIPDDIQGDQLIQTLTLLSEQVKGEPEGFTGASVLEPLATIGSSIIAEPLAGVAGIVGSVLPGDEGQGASFVESTREALTFQPRTEKGQAGLQAVGEFVQPVGDVIQGAEQALGETGFEVAGPIGGAIGETIPTAIGEALGVFGGRALKRLSKTKTRKAQEAIKALDDAERGIITEKGLMDVSDVIKKGGPDDIAAIVDADPNFYRAMDELNMTTEPLAGFASKNPQFRDIESALRKVPGSSLDPQAIAFIKETSQKADDLIQQYGGSLDKAQLGLDFKESALANIDDLAQQADDVYSALSDQLPKTGQYAASETVDFLKTKADELGGVGELPSKLQKLLKSLEPVDADGNRILPTLGKIDQVRREIGQATYKGTGTFKDVETGLNKALYARLTKDQDAIAKAAGLDEATSAAKGLIRQRKQLEDNLQVLLGKDLNKALNVTVSGALKKLSKGEIDGFNKIMNAIPKAQRGEVAISAMNDVFKGSGVGQSQLNPTQFVKWYDTIKRSPAAKKALFGALPKDSKKAIDNLYEVSRGISRSLQQTTPTGRINALFNEDTGFLRKMVGEAAARGIAFSTGSPVAAAATNATLDFLKQSTDGAKRASDLMSSSQFQNIIRRAVKEGVVDGNQASKALQAAEKSLTRSKKFKAWANALGADERAALQGGLLTYLFKDEEAE
jgi:hypothetical protein